MKATFSKELSQHSQLMLTFLPLPQTLLSVCVCRCLFLVSTHLLLPSLLLRLFRGRLVLQRTKAQARTQHIHNEWRQAVLMTGSRRSQCTKLSRAISSVPGIMISPLAPERSSGTCFSMSFNYLFDKCRAVEDASLDSQVSLWTGRWRPQQVRGRGTFARAKSRKISSFEVPSCIIYLRCIQHKGCIFNIRDAITCNICAVIEMRRKATAEVCGWIYQSF